ncbi:HK97 family phage prohead protease [bacterium]|nr:HK97 family phage prohead protease [bacterium]
MQWNSSGGTAKGKIKRIVKNGDTGIQGITGTTEDPAAVIAVWRKMGERYEESDVEVAHKFSTLRKIESLMKQDKIYTLMSKIKAVSQDSSTITIRGMASTSDIDRTGDIIEPSAWQKGGMQNYLNNPIILFNHDYNRPIGKGTDLRVTDKGLEITAKISKADPYIAQLITDGVLSTFSVGFKVKDADYMKDTGGLLIKDAELYEVSVVTVPANQAATFELVKSFSPAEFEAYKKGLITPDTGKLQAAKQSKGKFNMDEQELQALIAKQSAAAVKMALAERDAVEKKAREEEAKQKAQEEAIRTVAASAGASGAEKLLEEVKRAFDASRETTQKELDELKAALKDRAADVNALQNSKRAFVANTEKDWKVAVEADLRDAHVLGTVLNKGWNTKFGKSVIEKANSMSGGAMPADLTMSAYETIVSTSIERDIQNGLVLAPLFREIQLNAASMVIPILPDAGYAEFTTAKTSATTNTAQGNLEDRANAVGSPYNGITVATKTVSTRKLLSLTYLANETEEDAIIAILPLLTESMVRSHQRAVEAAMLLGQAAAPNATTGLTNNSFTGLVKNAFDNSLNTISGSAAAQALTAANLLALRKSLGKYGVNARDVVFVVNQTGYFNLLEDGEFQDMNLVGPSATKLTGEIGNVYGSRVLLCDEFKAPAFSGTGTTYALAVNPRNYIVPRIRGVTIESQYVPRLQHRELIATQRLGFDTLITTAPSCAVRTFASA